LIIFYCILLGAFVVFYIDCLIKPVTKPAAIPRTHARPWNTQHARKKPTVTLSFTNTLFAILSTWLALKIFHCRQIYRSNNARQWHTTHSTYSVFIVLPSTPADTSRRVGHRLPVRYSSSARYGKEKEGPFNLSAPELFFF